MKSVAMFEEKDLKFIGIFSSTRNAAKEILGDVNLNSSIGRYLSGQLNTLHGYVAIEVDASKGVTSALIEKSKADAKKRVKRSAIFKINSKLINLLSDEDASIISNIISKYND